MVAAAPVRGARAGLRAAALSCVAVLFVFSSCTVATLTGMPVGTEDPSSERETDPVAVKTALYFYMHAGDKWQDAALMTLNQLEAAALGHDTVVLALAELGGGGGAAADVPPGTQLYRIEADRSPEQVTSPRLSSELLGIDPDVPRSLDLGSSDVFERFLQSGEARYAAERTVIVLWGGGTLARAERVESGSTQPDRLNIHEAQRSVVARRPEIVVLDAGSGAMLEIAYELREAETALLASQSYGAPGRWDYESLAGALANLSRTPAANAEQLLKAASAADRTDYGATASVISSAAADAVVGALNELARVVGAGILSAVDRERIRDRLFYDVAEFYRTPGNLNLDLREAAAALAELVPESAAQAQALRDAVDAAVLAAWRHSSRTAAANGLSVHYVPLDMHGYPTTHHESYSSGNTADGIDFSGDSLWAPNRAKSSGLLYRLWYQTF